MAETGQLCTHTLDDRTETVVSKVKDGWNRLVVHSQPRLQNRNSNKHDDGCVEQVSYAFTF